MTELLTVLTNATEGSRALSDRVLLALGWEIIERTVRDGLPIGWRDTAGRNVFDAPNPTVNLQDAVNLVPVGLHWMVCTRATPLGKNTAEGVVRTPGLQTSPGYFAKDVFHHTAPLALCLAILEYIEAQT